jgi:hypothetical protein
MLARNLLTLLLCIVLIVTIVTLWAPFATEPHFLRGVIIVILIALSWKMQD